MKKEIDLSMKRLHEISTEMNDEDLPLEDALKLYKEASELIAFCKEELGDAQLELKEIFSGESP